MRLKTEFNNNLEKWSDDLDSKGFRLSRTKTEYLECKVGEGEESMQGITMCDTAILIVVKFKHLGSIIQGNGEIDDDIGYRIRVG